MDDWEAVTVPYRSPASIGAARDMAIASVDGVPREAYTLRVTHVYRREDGEWKSVHRHGDAPPVDQRLPGEPSTAEAVT